MVDKNRVAKAFFGYFPTCQMFSKDIRTHRDELSREERWLRTALDYLADLVGRTHTDLLGQYFGAQTGGQQSEPFINDLLHCYDDAFQAHFGRPSGAFPNANP